jgi:hypothetical protein
MYSPADRVVPGSTLIVHPSITSYFHRWIRNLALAVVAITLVVLIYRWATIPGAGTAFLAALAALALFAVAFFRRAQISVDDGVVAYRRLLWSRRFPRDSVGGLALRRLSLRTNYYAASARPYAVVYGRNGRALFSFSAALWSDRDLRALQQSIGGNSSDLPVSASELQSEFPGALPGWLLFYEAHPIWTLVIGTPLMLVAIIIAVVVWEALKSR